VIIRGVHHSIPDEHIKTSLTLPGPIVRFINRPKIRYDKTNFVHLVFDEIEPSSTNKKIHEIKTLCRQRVQVELPYKKAEVVQCHRCRDFNHTKNTFFLNHNCVRCVKHAIEVCERDIHPIKCVNCGENHTANYKAVLFTSRQ